MRLNLRYLSLVFTVIFNFNFLLLQPSNYTKMEKADILEMTVKFVENLKKKPQQPKTSSSPEPGHDFEKGYQACQQEIAKFLDMAAFPQDLKIRLNQHLQAKHSPSTSTITSSTPQTPIQPKVVPPQEFTAMLTGEYGRYEEGRLHANLGDSGDTYGWMLETHLD